MIYTLLSTTHDAVEVNFYKCKIVYFVLFYILRRHGQVVRQWIANPLFPSSNLGAAYLYKLSIN